MKVCDSKVTSLKEDHGSEIAGIKAKHEAEEDKLQRSIAAIKETFEQELVVLKDALERLSNKVYSMETELTVKSESEIKKTKRDLEWSIKDGLEQAGLTLENKINSAIETKLGFVKNATPEEAADLNKAYAIQKLDLLQVMLI